MSPSHDDVRALAAANEQMVQLFLWLDAQPASLRTTRGVDLRIQDGTVIVEMFVEAKVNSGLGICYWLESRIGERHCAVEGSVLFQEPGGQSTHRSETIETSVDGGLSETLVSMMEALWSWRVDGLEHAIAMRPESSSRS